jgi:hypothetical protein
VHPDELAALVSGVKGSFSKLITSREHSDSSRAAGIGKKGRIRLQPNDTLML